MRVFSVWVLNSSHFLRRHMCFFPLLASLIVRRMNNTNMIRSNNMKMKCAWGFDVKNGDVDVFIHNSCIWSTFEWILRHEVSVDFTVRKQKKSAKLMKSAKRQSKKNKTHDMWKRHWRYTDERNDQSTKHRFILCNSIWYTQFLSFFMQMRPTESEWKWKQLEIIKCNWNKWTIANTRKEKMWTK